MFHRSGVLFHHETQTKDWFYDMMKPFKHYVPVNLELTDLKGKFDWAEASQDRIQEIALEGKMLAKHLLSEEYMAKLYDDLFLDFLGKVVNNYVVTSPTWKENLDQYKDHGFKLTEVAYCRATKCFVNVRDGAFKSFPHVFKKAVSLQANGFDTESLNANSNENKMNLRPLASTSDSPETSNKNSFVSVAATNMMIEEAKSPAEGIVEEDDDDAIDEDSLAEGESLTSNGSDEDKSFSIVDTSESAPFNDRGDIQFSNSNTEEKLQRSRVSGEKNFRSHVINYNALGQTNFPSTQCFSTHASMANTNNDIQVSSNVSFLPSPVMCVLRIGTE
jgi:Glycosyl transferase family 90